MINAESKEKLVQIVERVPVPEKILVDNWVPSPDDLIFKHSKGIIYANIAPLYGMPDNSDINYFMMSSKRCYNSETKINKEGNLTIGFREHNTTYLNYFEKFFDRGHVLLGLMAQIKYLIDYRENYSEDNLLNDLVRYIIDYKSSPIIHYQISCMNDVNYYIEFDYKNKNNPCLEYSKHHATIFMEISLLQNMIIPLLAHFIYTRKYNPIDIKRVLLRVFDRIFIMVLNKYRVNMYSKLLETTRTKVNQSTISDSGLWGMQDIRARNPTIHSIATVEDIIVQIIPKYIYSKSVICFNLDAINRDIKYKVVDIPYEYALTTVSSSNRDDDNNSEIDKFEAHMTKQDEAMLLQVNVNATTTMRRIIEEYGPFSKEEIDFYRKELTADGKALRNDFQENLVAYLFQRYFYDTQAVRMVNDDEYIILMISAKRKLILEGQKLLPFVIGGKISRFVTRKTVNKKIMQRTMLSDNYPKVVNKYRNPKIYEQNLSKIIAQILASEFKNIDFYNSELHGVVVPAPAVPEIICEEILMFSLMI